MIPIDLSPELALMQTIEFQLHKKLAHCRGQDEPQFSDALSHLTHTRILLEKIGDGEGALT